MNNKETNEYIAVNLFGIDITEYPSHDLKDHKGYMWWCNQCKKLYAETSKREVDLKHKCQQDIPNYISNYQPVLNELFKKDIGFEVAIQQDKGILVQFGFVVKMIDTASQCVGYGNGDTVGEAICNAAVGYLQAKQNGEVK